MNKYYAGVGSRETPKDILDIMSKLAIKLESIGYTLRSGGANGADSAFASDVDNKIVYIPWPGFNGINTQMIPLTSDAECIAKSIHPAWNRLPQGAQKLHIRNVYQVLGEDLDPNKYSKFVICWTRNAEVIGGTATAIRLANSYGIPVYNLENPIHLDRILKFINT